MASVSSNRAWHPAIRSVEGDADRPAQLGDRITEHVVINGIEGTGTWLVVARDRPHRLVLEADLPEGRFRIGYEFMRTTIGDGQGTRMRRDLEFPELGAAVAGAMQAQSAEGMERLGRLVGEQLAATSRTPAGRRSWLTRAGVGRTAAGGGGPGRRQGRVAGPGAGRCANARPGRRDRCRQGAVVG